MSKCLPAKATTNRGLRYYPLGGGPRREHLGLLYGVSADTRLTGNGASKDGDEAKLG